MRFGIRDVLWLTVLVAVGVAWLIDHRRLAAERHDLREHLLRRAAENALLQKSHRNRINELESLLERANISIPRGPTIGELMEAIERQDSGPPQEGR